MDCVATAPTPARPHVTTEPTENQCDWTATPHSPVCGSWATMEYVPRRMTARYTVVLARVRAIPEGFVRSYGDISPGAPRFGGTVLSQTDEDVPWWRGVGGGRRGGGAGGGAARARGGGGGGGAPPGGGGGPRGRGQFPPPMWISR